RDQLIFADHVITIADEILQEVEHLRFDGDEIHATSQFSPFDVQRIMLEDVDHRGSEQLRPNLPDRKKSVESKEISKAIPRLSRFPSGTVPMVAKQGDAMKLHRRELLQLGSAAALASLVSPLAAAEHYPARPVQIVAG